MLDFLRRQHIPQIIAPIATRKGQLWMQLDQAEFTATLYPFVEGHNGFQEPLTDSQWRELGKALKRIHLLALPSELLGRIPRERYSRQWCEKVKLLLARSAQESFADPVARDVAAFLTLKAEEILYLVRRTEQLGERMQARQPEGVPCHSDLHAGNVLMDASGRLYIIDWDNSFWRPKSAT